jgi:hypothetical protein
MSYVLSVPNAVDLRYRLYGRPGRRLADGYIAKEDKSWFVQSTLKRAHRWKTIERAEAAALIVVISLPEFLGKLVPVEVAKVGKVWMRAKNVPRSHRDW